MESYTPSNSKASFVDIFIGGSGSTSGAGARGRGNVNTTWQHSVGGRFLILCVFVGFGVFLAVSVVFFGQESGSGSSNGMGNFVKTGNRYEDIKTVLLLNSASHTEYLTDTATSAYHAFRWLTDTDPAQLEADDPELLARFALATLYYASHPDDAPAHSSGETATIDSGWKNDAKWMSKASICQWYGVECESILGQNSKDVVHLNLTSNNVQGSIPHELRSLSNMAVLDLSNNNLQGSIPVQVCRMYQIAYMLLQNNKLSGTIPSQINMMEGAYEIYLTNNNLQGTIPSAIASLSNLKALSLGGNQLEGSIPDISALRELSKTYTIPVLPKCLVRHVSTCNFLTTTVLLWFLQII